MPKLGPGTLKIGETGTEIDASCLINNAAITSEKDEGDSKTMLCGTQKAGNVTYTFTLEGNIDTDTDDAAGLFALSWSAMGTEVPFTFTPSTEGVTSASGVLVIDPLDFGADEYGEYLNSDFEWTLVGEPEFTYPEAPADGTETFAATVVRGRPKAGVKPKVTKAPSRKALTPEEIKAERQARNTTAAKPAKEKVPA